MQIWAGAEDAMTALLPDGVRVAEGALHYALDRAITADADRAVLVLHLSRLPAPGARPHHRRIARAVMDDAAFAQSGQVFIRPGGDLLLIGDPGAAATLAETLIRLFRLDGPGADQLLGLWDLPADADAVLDYVAAAPAWPAPAGPGARPPQPDGAPADTLHRQTAVVLGPAGGRPLFRELTLDSPQSAAQAGGADGPEHDPFLCRHLASPLGGRLLRRVQAELAAGQFDGGPRLHLNLTIPAAASAAFADLQAAATGVALAVEFALIDICADLAGFAAARTRLQHAGIAVVLDQIGHGALLLVEPDLLGADLAKLDWSPRMAALPARERHAIAAALARLGPDRVVLAGADTDEALDWGRGHGIRCFQGSRIDTMQAASRLMACPVGQGCTLRQCAGRAAAMNAAGRAGCRDPARLGLASLPTG